MSRRPGLENPPTQTARLVALLREQSPQWVPSDSFPEFGSLAPESYGVA
jgi:hypothetical protein